MSKHEILVGELLEIGDVKPTNQDSLLTKVVLTHLHNVGLFVVADGMGGHAYGEEISKLAVTYFNRWCDEILIPFVNSNYFELNMVDQLLNEAILEINNLSLSFSRQMNKKAGTTLSLLLVVGDRYFIKNLGDSRIYLIRKNKKVQLTKDQSLVAQMVRNKEITEEEARQHSQRNVLTMCLGVFEEIQIFSSEGKINRGDVFLLCSDGFYNFVDESEVLTIIKDSRCQDYNQKVLLLRSKIPPGSARDNISLILVKVGAETRFSYLKYLLELVGVIWK